MTCPELQHSLRGEGPEGLVKREALNPAFWEITWRWYHYITREDGAGSGFEGMLYLWMLFNGWATHVVESSQGMPSDAFMVSAIAFDPTFRERYRTLVDENPTFARLTATFASLLPVFQNRELVAGRLGPWSSDQARRRYVDRVLALKPSRLGWFAPPCFEKHDKRLMNHTQSHCAGTSKVLLMCTAPGFLYTSL